MRWLTLCALPLAALLSSCGNQPEPQMIPKPVLVRLDIDPEKYAPVIVPVPPERGATLKAVTAYGTRQSIALRACNLKLEQIGRDVEAQALPPPPAN